MRNGLSVSRELRLDDGAANESCVRNPRDNSRGGFEQMIDSYLARQLSFAQRWIDDHSELQRG